MVKFRNSNLYILLLSIGTAVIICIALTAVLAQLALMERVGEQGTEWGIMLIILLSSIVGSIMNRLSTPKNPMIGAIASVGLLMIILIAASLLIDGAYENVWMRLAALVTGGGIGCAISTKFHHNKGGRKRRHW